MTLLTRALTRARLWRCERVGPGTVVLGRVWIHGRGRIQLGARVVLDGRRAPIELHAREGGTLTLEDDVRVEGGASIEALHSVVVGRRAVLRRFSKVLDNHFHPVSGDRHEQPKSDAVQIGEGVEVGERAIVLPGAKLEANVKLEAGVVIGRRVPAGTVLQGFPPKAVRKGAP